MKLYIANKNYSSWSMRAWVLLRQAAIPFEEVMLRFGRSAVGAEFGNRIAEVGAAGRVPVLVDGSVTVWDSLAIAEYVAERFPDRALWPADIDERAHARSICAEMHAGFAALRTACPMNISASLPAAGTTILRQRGDVRTDVERITAIWTECLAHSGGPLLFTSFTIADAYFAPVVMRFRTYGLPCSEATRRYVDAIAKLPAVAEWMAGALEENAWYEPSEPYRTEQDAHAGTPK